MKPEDSPSPATPCPSREELAAFAGGFLPSQALEAIAAHLSQCPKCEAAFEALARTRPLLESRPRTPPDDGFSDEAERALMEAGAREIQPQISFPAPDSGPGAVPGFHVQKQIAKGSGSAVLLAEQEAPQRRVALKVLTTANAVARKQCKRFIQDVAVAALLPGSRILPVFDVLQSDRRLVIVMPYVDGIDLGAIVRGRRASRLGSIVQSSHPWLGLDDSRYLTEALAYLDQVIETLARIHERGDRYRELKPANCLVDPEGNAWLTDFGLTRLLDRGVGVRLNDFDPFPPTRDEEPAGLQITLGAPGVISPEEWRGGHGDQRTDVFALGVLLYQALTFDLPYGIAPLLSRKPSPKLPSARQPLLPTAFDPIIVKALQLNPEDRYRSATDLRADWQRVQESERHPAAGWLPTLLRRLRKYWQRPG
jgi:serine/threonine protein kinase